MYEIISSGFGGQGALTIGKFLAKAGMKEGKHVSWLPSYGPEMRGGTANVSAVISETAVASPIVTFPNVLVALNQPSLDKFAANVVQGGFIIANEDLCPNIPTFEGVKTVSAPLSKLATEIGSDKVLNMLAIGMVIGLTDMIKYETIEEDLTAFLQKKNPELLKMNLSAIQKGIELVK
jgi:2-oxoglutarate ferredoxin oxidoreductase subunit gamma